MSDCSAPLVESEVWEVWAKAGQRTTLPGAEPVRVVLLGEPHGKGRPRSRIALLKTARGLGDRPITLKQALKVLFIAVYTPRETQQYENALALAGRAAMKTRPPLTGPLRVNILAVMDVPSSWSGKKKTSALHGSLRPTVSPDWDNIGKSLDALNGIVFEDDKQIVSANVEKVYGQLPRLEVEIIEIAAAGLFST
jgi:Holliday junction resolvase RusA-like endonuclease